MVEADPITLFRNLFRSLNAACGYREKTKVFNLTDKVAKALIELKIPSSEREFKDVIENLYIILYESTGDGKRLPLGLDEKQSIKKLKLLRNHFFHDQEQGSPSEVKKKFAEIGEIYQEIIGTKTPYKAEHWKFATEELLNKFNKFLSLSIDNVSNLSNFMGNNKHDHDASFSPYYESEITIFPDKRQKFRTIEKNNEFHALADAPIFIPDFGLRSPPIFGNNSAIHFHSKAYNANLEGYKKFLNKIETIWTKEMPNVTRDISNYLPWSISDNGKLLYGAGFNNLIQAIKQIKIGIITILLMGEYGEDYSKSFFIIITNYWKGGYFRDNYLDIYLSNVPLDLSWIMEFNNSIKLLSDHNEIANSYSLKSYTNHFWRSEKKFEIKGKIIGGIGREGYDEHRNWDSFIGLIFNNPFQDKDFKLEEEICHNINDRFLKCPTNSFKEIVMSITNSPPEVEEITSGKFHGFARPTIDHFIFDGYGHEIHALLFWGLALTKD